MHTRIAAREISAQKSHAHDQHKPFVLAASIIITLSANHAAQKQPAPSLPYTAAHDPQFIPASAATFLHDPDRVIGLTVGAVAKAYPAAILSQHGLVEDQSPSGPIAVTW